MRGLLRSALGTLGALAGVALLVGALPWLTGDDPARSVLRAREADREPDAATLDTIRTQLHLPTDPLTGTLSWVGRVLRGDLGTSWVSGTPVGDVVLPALGVSLTLAAAASATALLLAALMVLPSLRRAADGSAPRGSGVVSGALAAVPEFVLAALLVAVVAVAWRLAPASGFAGPEYLVLPTLALALPAAGVLARLLSDAVDSTAAEQWVRTWRAAGVGRGRTAVAVARRASTVAVPQTLLLLVGLLGAGAVVEAVFDVPGLGGQSLAAALAQDVPVVQAAVVLLVAVGLAVGGAGVLLHRLMLGPALVGGGLSPEPPPPGQRAGRAVVVLTGLLALVVVAGLLRDPAAQDTADRLAPPSWVHPFGADALGRDVLARFGHGALFSIGLAAAVSVAVLAVGLLVGLLGRRQRAGLADVLNALPAVVVGIVLAAVVGPGLTSAVVAVALVAWIPLAVHTRTLVAETRATGFVTAALTSGSGSVRLMRRHLLPAVAPPVARHALIRVPHTALALAGLSFLGLGAGPESPEWGRALAENIGYLERAPWVVAAPTLGLVAVGVLASLVRTSR